MNIWTGAKIRSLRQRLGWSMADLSRRLGCASDVVRALECEELHPTREQEIQFERLFFHLEIYNDQTASGPKAESVLAQGTVEQIHRSDLLKYN